MWCQTACASGHYNVTSGCQDSCGKGCDGACDVSNGTCTCKPGWKSPRCNGALTTIHSWHYLIFLNSSFSNKRVLGIHGRKCHRNSTTWIQRSPVAQLVRWFDQAVVVAVTLTTYFTSTEAKLLISDGDGGGGGGEECERVKALPRVPPEKDRRDRRPPPKQRKC